MAEIEVVVTTEPVRLARERLATLLRATADERGSMRFAIPGGSALKAVEGLREAVGESWQKLLLTWVDERCVPFDSPDSNRGAAHRSGALDRAHAPAVELGLFEDGESPTQALARIEQSFRERFEGALDVLLLGMGPDGHIASLFPGRPMAEGVADYVSQSPKPPPERITLTRSTLATARRSVLLAMGESKRTALERLLAGDPALAAVGLPGLVVFTDVDVAP